MAANKKRDRILRTEKSQNKMSRSLNVIRIIREAYDEWIAAGKPIPMPEMLHSSLNGHVNMIEMAFCNMRKLGPKRKQSSEDHLEIVMLSTFGATELLYCKEALPYLKITLDGKTGAVEEEYIKEIVKMGEELFKKKFNKDSTSLFDTGMEELQESLIRNRQKHIKKNKDFFSKYRISNVMKQLYQDWIDEGRKGESPEDVTMHILSIMDDMKDNAKSRNGHSFDELMDSLLIHEELVFFEPIIKDLCPEHNAPSIAKLIKVARKMLKANFNYEPKERQIDI